LSDRPGIMAEIAGTLALLGLAIRSARTVTVDDVAMSLWEVTRPDVAETRLRERLVPVLRGEVDLDARLALKGGDDEVPPRIRILPRRSETATVLEVRAQDRRGLVWTVCRAIAAGGHSIRSAHLSTYGTEARDVFYVVDADGLPLSDDAALKLRQDLVDAV
jgi:[protein-PII] uridylyltransferase